MSKERFRIWIIVEINENDFHDAKDMENQCINFFNAFSKEHLSSLKFEIMSVGYDYEKHRRDLTFAKYYEHVEDAYRILEILRIACEKYVDTITIKNHKPFIEKSYLENKLQALQYEITAFNLLKNF